MTASVDLSNAGGPGWIVNGFNRRIGFLTRQ
jgi:hypothetical protein